MQYWILVITFAFCFVLKAAQADQSSIEAVLAQAESESANADVQSEPAEVQSTPVQQNYSSQNNYSSMRAKRYERSDSTGLVLIPMAGGSDFVGQWGQNVTNSYSLGLALEFAATEKVAFEVEGGYGRYNTRYVQRGRFYSHDFSQYAIGANAKYYLVKSAISPYLGAGVAGLYYENMDRGPFFYGRTYSQWVGVGQALVGADAALSETMGIGIRGAWLMPVFNRPHTADDGATSLPGYEDSGLMNSSQYRIMATMRLAF